MTLIAIPEAPRTPKTLCCGACTEDAEEELGCVAGPLLLSVLIVVCGTASTITSKLQYEVRSRASSIATTRPNHEEVPFHEAVLPDPGHEGRDVDLLADSLGRAKMSTETDGQLAEALLANDAPRQTPDRSAILAVAAPWRSPIYCKRLWLKQVYCSCRRRRTR